MKLVILLILAGIYFAALSRKKGETDLEESEKISVMEQIRKKVDPLYIKYWSIPAEAEKDEHITFEDLDISGSSTIISDLVFNKTSSQFSYDFQIPKWLMSGKYETRVVYPDKNYFEGQGELKYNIENFVFKIDVELEEYKDKVLISNLKIASKCEVCQFYMENLKWKGGLANWNAINEIINKAVQIVDLGENNRVLEEAISATVNLMRALPSDVSNSTGESESERDESDDDSIDLLIELFFSLGNTTPEIEKQFRLLGGKIVN